MPHGPIQPNTLRGGVSRPNLVERSLERAAGLAGSGRRLPFGPNSDAVAALLGRVAALGPVQAQRLVSFWSAVPEGERAQAHAAAQQAAEKGGRRSAARAAQIEAMRWLDDQLTSSDLWGAEGASGQARDWAQIRREAFPAVLDAVAATVLADLLERPALDALLGPWLTAVSGPAADVAGDG